MRGGEGERRRMKWEIVHLPANPYNPLEVPTVDVLAAVIEPKLANSLVRKLNQNCLLENLRHVKRIRKRTVEGKIELSVVLCISEDYEGHAEGTKGDLHQIVSEYELCLFRAKVAKYAATTKEEWEEQCKLWPTSFHPPNNSDNIALLSEEDMELASGYMKLAIQLSHHSCTIMNAAVIVDPMSKQVIARACDQTCLTPSLTYKANKRHACSAENEATATYSNTDGNDLSGPQEVPVPNMTSDKHEESYVGVSCLNPWGWTQIRPSQKNSLVNIGSNCSWHPLKHAALVAIENAAARDRRLFPSSGSYNSETQTDETLLTADDFPMKRQKVNILEECILANEVSGKCLSAEVMRPYLCTGFDIYLAWEPCSMCAMALVHQRIRRIFFAYPNPHTGALGSVFRLQGEKSLNHHYSVYRIVIPEEDFHELEVDAPDS